MELKYILWFLNSFQSKYTWRIALSFGALPCFAVIYGRFKLKVSKREANLELRKPSSSEFTSLLDKYKVTLFGAACIIYLFIYLQLFGFWPAFHFTVTIFIKKDLLEFFILLLMMARKSIFHGFIIIII